MATAIMKQKEVPEMDDVEEIISKISEESPYKRRPTQKRTWMTVPEMGKLLGLTWDCVDISPEAIEENRAYVFINKESQRISCLLYTSPSPRDRQKTRMPSSA